MTPPPDDHGPRIMWAPWRMTYLDAERAPGAESACVFCDIIARHDDAADYVLHRGRHCFVVLNLYPYNNGHLMVIPYQHTESLLDIDDDAAAELMSLTRRAQRVVVDVFRPDGVNVGMNQGTAAGAGIGQHLHMHLLPRWRADTNFMTSLAHTRVMPQGLDETYSLLRPGFPT